MRISLPFKKILKTEYLLQQAILAYENKQTMQCTQLAAVNGQLCHCIFSHGSIVRICSRNASNLLGISVQAHGWSGWLRLNKAVHTEFVLCLKFLRSFNGQPIVTDYMRVDIVYPHQIQICIEQVDPLLLNRHVKTFCSGRDEKILINFILMILQFFK